MAKFPFMALYWDALLVDTDHLSDAEFGRYMRVLGRLWLAPKQRLPNDDAWLARRFARDEKWVREELRPIFSEFCQRSGNWITQKRVTREFQRAAKIRHLQSERAKKRWNKEKDDAAAVVSRKASTTTITTTEVRGEDTGTNLSPESERFPSTSTSTRTRKKRARDLFAGEEIIFPDWWPKAAWDGFVAMRKTQRKPLTKHAAELIVAAVTRFRESGDDPALILDNSTRNGWLDVFPLRRSLQGVRASEPIITLKDIEEFTAKKAKAKEAKLL